MELKLESVQKTTVHAGACTERKRRSREGYSMYMFYVPTAIKIAKVISYKKSSISPQQSVIARKDTTKPARTFAPNGQSPASTDDQNTASNVQVFIHPHLIYSWTRLVLLIVWGRLPGCSLAVDSVQGCERASKSFNAATATAASDLCCCNCHPSYCS